MTSDYNFNLSFRTQTREFTAINWITKSGFGHCVSLQFEHKRSCPSKAGSDWVVALLFGCQLPGWPTRWGEIWREIPKLLRSVPGKQENLRLEDPIPNRIENLNQEFESLGTQIPYQKKTVVVSCFWIVCVCIYNIGVTKGSLIWSEWSIATTLHFRGQLYSFEQTPKGKMLNSRNQPLWNKPKIGSFIQAIFCSLSLFLTWEEEPMKMYGICLKYPVI